VAHQKVQPGHAVVSQGRFQPHQGAQRPAPLPEYLKSGQLNVIFNSQPVEIREKSVLLDVAGQVREIANDYVWVFAGGIPPNEFLQKVGIRIGQQDITREGTAEAQLARRTA
jgi:thioredoxin reductase (NADPH)